VCEQSRTERDLVECAVISMVAKVKREVEESTNRMGKNLYSFTP
jgi:hypothetical protein